MANEVLGATMKYVIAFIATRWGSELGGINVFNTGLAKGMAAIAPQESECLCFIEKLPEESHQDNGVKLIVHSGNANNIAEEIRNLYFNSQTVYQRKLLVVGHDDKTGKLAIDCAKILKKYSQEDTEIHSAVISHMDYSAYGRMKGNTQHHVGKRSQEQHAIVANADFAFAVGPLLTKSFQVDRKKDSGDISPVCELIPGAASIQPKQEDETNILRFFVSGRLSREDETIKNGYLSMEALLNAYIKQKKLNSEKWMHRGLLVLFGVNPIDDSTVLDPIKDRARDLVAYDTESYPFSDDQTSMYERLASSHVALMPSWHEGFGLTGWEALCAGVPLVCSRQSGLSMLLDDLRHRFTDIPFDSFEYVDLSGSNTPGESNPKDVDKISDALIKIIDNYPHRKKSANLMARRLKLAFSWEGCAIELIQHIGWEWPSSSYWRIRQTVATALDVEKALEICRIDDIENGWRSVCTGLNWLSSRGKTKIIEKNKFLQDLKQIGGAITTTLKESNQEEAEIQPVALRDTGNLDLCWRFMAACASMSPSFRTFKSLISTEIQDAICSEGFLTRELVFYASKFSDEFEHQSQELARQFFQPIQAKLQEDELLQKRIARISTIYPSILELFVFDKTLCQSFYSEKEKCEKLQALSYDATTLLHETPSLAPTLLALSGLKQESQRQSVDQTINFFNDYQPKEKQVELLWRGDKRLYAGIVTSGIPSERLLEVLNAMAEDEEEAIRWAAVEMAFSRTLRKRLESEALVNRVEHYDQLLRHLGEIVDKAVSFDGSHPWIQREFLKLYEHEHSDLQKDSELRKFSIFDFPESRKLFGPLVSNSGTKLLRPLHPEVLDVKDTALSHLKRILLVLPPIEVPTKNSPYASKTSTPPLGLGSIATYLSMSGHDVQLADCHRYPDLYHRVLEIAHTFDLIGFNVVFSTMKSTRNMLRLIRKEAWRPILLVGGPAVNMNAWQFSSLDDEERQSWDFAISGEVFKNLSRLVLSLGGAGPWPKGKHLVANDDSILIALRDVIDSSTDNPSGSESVEWKTINIDRRVYQGPAGQYEPTQTRNIKANLHEAHVVMSRGCDWNCTFCTERRTLSDGERRREVDAVLSELAFLSRSYPSSLRIQFIDDNLLPQIAAPDNENMVTKARAEEWARKFFKGLSELGKQRRSQIGWRGIFRLEDFFFYEKLWTPNDFIDQLVESGCRMLAFGVEHGDEKYRKKLKVGANYCNDQIVELFARLRKKNIHTKAYFMLGGKKETVQSAQKTIQFALECGVTLAYFALYKEFVKARSVLTRDGVPIDEATQYLSYKQLWTKWDSELISQVPRISKGEKSEKEARITLNVSEKQVSCYGELSNLGFRFDDLVKYNDYHDNEGPSGKLLDTITWNSPGDYFQIVEQAYLRFYLRPQFISDFKRLIENGY